MSKAEQRLFRWSDRVILAIAEFPFRGDAKGVEQTTGFTGGVDSPYQAPGQIVGQRMIDKQRLKLRSRPAPRQPQGVFQMRQQAFGYLGCVFFQAFQPGQRFRSFYLVIFGAQARQALCGAPCWS